MPGRSTRHAGQTIGPAAAGTSRKTAEHLVAGAEKAACSDAGTAPASGPPGDHVENVPVFGAAEGLAVGVVGLEQEDFQSLE